MSPFVTLFNPSSNALTAWRVCDIPTSPFTAYRFSFNIFAFLGLDLILTLSLAYLPGFPLLGLLGLLSLSTRCVRLDVLVSSLCVYLVEMSTYPPFLSFL